VPQIPSLPTLTVEVAFNPTQILSTVQTWTTVTQYAMDFTTRGGRQHFLDRIEASGLSMTLDGRDGFFMNGTLNGTGQILRPRIPIRVTASWGGTSYPVFWGITESVETRIQDQVNVEYAVTATDMLKFLSLRYLNCPDLYGQYVNGTSATAWYRFNGSGKDSLNTWNGAVQGYVDYVDGVLVYDDNQGIDLTNGTDAPTASFRFPNQTGVSGISGLDFWILGASAQNEVIFPVNIQAGFSSIDATLTITNTGQVNTAFDDMTAYPVITDGMWHHVALIVDSGAQVKLIVDGQTEASSTLAVGGIFIDPALNNVLEIGGSLAVRLDEMVASDGTVTEAEVQARYQTGSLLRKDQTTGDRIAEILAVAGFPSTKNSAQQYIPTGYTIDWDQSGSAPAYVPGAVKNGTWVWGVNSNVTGNTALDLIYSTVDTENGIFFQGDEGTLNYHSGGYQYRPAGNATPTGAYVWTDDTTSSYHYDGPSLAVTRDDVDVWTTVVVSPANGNPQTYQAPTVNTDLYGWSTLTKSTSYSSSTQQVARLAEFLGKIYAKPLPRVSSVQLRSETSNGGNNTILLGANIQDRVNFKRNPPGASGAGIIATDMIIESINHEWTANPGYWHTTYTLDPYPISFTTASPATFCMILDSSTYGKLDQNILG